MMNPHTFQELLMQNQNMVQHQFQELVMHVEEHFQNFPLNK